MNGNCSGVRCGVALAVACVIGLGLSRGTPAGAQQERAGFTATFEEKPRVKGQLAKLAALEQQKAWDEWINTYQMLVDEYPDAVVTRDEEFLVGLRFHLHGMLGRLPAALKQKYRMRFDGDARQLHDQAAAAIDEVRMRQVYARFRHSTYGPRALNWIANRALDSGNAETARIAFSRVIAEGGAPAATFFKYALAARAGGNDAEAKAALERVAREQATAPVKLAGESLTAAAAARQLLGTLGETSPSSPGWPNFGGPANDGHMTGSAAASWKRAWDYPYPQPQSSGRLNSRRDAIFPGGTQPRTRYGFTTFPIVAGGRAYIQGVRSAAALDLEDGRVLWSSEEFGAQPAESGPVRRIFRGGYSSRRSGQSQGAPALDSGLLAVRMGVQTSQAVPYGTSPSDFQLAVLDARGGKQLWRRTWDGEPPEGVYFNMPALRDNTLFTGVISGMAGITEYRAVALEAGTGDILWSTYLGGGSDSMAGVDGSPPVVRDGVVWIESSLHTLNAVDMITGEIRTIYRYQPKSRLATIGFSEAALPNEVIGLLPGTGPMVFSSRWGDQVVAIDAAKGNLLWSAPKQGATSLFAVDKGSAYLCGQLEVAAFDMETGAKRWTWNSPGTQSNTGYAALVGDRLYLVVEGKLYAIDAASGEGKVAADLTEFVGEPAGYTTLLAVGKRLLVSMRDRVIALEPAP